MPPTEAPEPWGGGLWDRLPKQKRRTWLSQLGGFVEGQKGDDEGGGGGGGSMTMWYDSSGTGALVSLTRPRFAHT